MKQLIFAVTLLTLFLTSFLPAFAQTQPDTDTKYFKGRIIDISTESEDQTTTRVLTIEAVEGSDKGKRVDVMQTISSDDTETLPLEKGETIIVSKITTGNDIQYGVYDRYRLSPLLFILGTFFLLVVVMAGKKGIGAIIGLFISIAVLLLYIIPQIISGANPLFITISGSLAIMLTTIYLAHGFSQKTTVAIGGVFLSLLITGFLTTFMVELLSLTGLGSEDAALLHVGNAQINLKGLLLGGIIIGTLGVLDDVATTQAATIYALSEANEKYSTKTLIKKGFLVGREHITSLVNTLVLAYAGASLPIFIFYVLNPLDQPNWLLLNNEMIMEEIVRTLTGSIGLIMAVPITTVLAAFFAKYKVSVAH